MAIVTFDPAAFKVAYPEFAGATDARCQAQFDIAQYTLLDNTDNSPVMDVNFRSTLFNLIVAHLLLLLGAAPTVRPDGTVDNTPPGRISSATEGTVSMSSEYNAGTQASASMAYWTQTKYGAQFWASTARFRSFIYAPNGGSGIGYSKAYGIPPYNIPGGV
ncbi:DUF4054 domain-containing protein [Klebsiella aerogenes]|uniref:DUF4054 domain-containing protein n=2 Tax=Gammaproteobacteria TaxID=1236 RepID=UPI0037AE32CB